jgi:hypothetical protein
VKDRTRPFPGSARQQYHIDDTNCISITPPPPHPGLALSPPFPPYTTHASAMFHDPFFIQPWSAILGGRVINSVLLSVFKP